MRNLVGCVLLLCSCGIDDAGVLASDVEIVAGCSSGAGTTYWLAEIPSTAGFHSADFSELYSHSISGFAPLGDYGAAAALGGYVSLWPTLPITHPITGREGGTVSIPFTGPTWLYQALVWPLEPGRAHDAVYFQPVPGQPVPDGTLPVTTFLVVCPTPRIGAANGCRSWPSAVKAGLVTCRDVISKQPIAEHRCVLMAPYTRWKVNGVPPGGYPIAVDLLEFLAADATAAMDD